MLAPLAPCHRPFPGTQTPQATPLRTIVFSCTIRKQNNGWIVDFPGWKLYCISLMFTIFSICFQPISHTTSMCVSKALIGNSFSHCLLQHTCHPYRSFISNVFTETTVGIRSMDVGCGRMCAALMATLRNEAEPHIFRTRTLSTFTQNTDTLTCLM